MTLMQINKLKAGRPGSSVLVKGTVRTIDSKNPNAIEIQFTNYGLWIPIKDIQYAKNT
jgi:hypothetical protein